MILWFFYDSDWVLPAAGFLVGWFTNWVALKIIFKPLEPHKICFGCYTLHGIFLKRQQEVADIYARVICTEIVHIKAIFEDGLLNGPLSKNFNAMLRAHTLVYADKVTAELKPLVIAAMGKAQFDLMKEEIAQQVVDELPCIIDLCYEYATEALNLEKELSTKMKALSPSEFEGVLHPAFEQDEILLIILGGVLGAIVGLIQIFTIFNKALYQ